MTSNAERAAKAGFAYFGLILALGFALGTVRVLLLAPVVGELFAVIAELPIMIGASWLAAGWLMMRFGLVTFEEKALMGAFAFMLLMAAEAVLGMFLFGQAFVDWLANLFRTPGIIGFCGQIVFAAIPTLRR